MRDNALVVSWTNIGTGQLVLSLPPEDLVAEGQLRVAGPPTPEAVNCRMLDGLVKPRPGYDEFADRPNTRVVTGLYFAQFDDGATEILRTDSDGSNADLWYTASAAPTAWTQVTNATGDNLIQGNLSKYEPTTFAMVRYPGGTTKKTEVFLSRYGNGSTTGYAVKAYRSGGAALVNVAASTFCGARAIVGHKGRALICNVYDVGLTARKYQRIYGSALGTPETYTGIGSFVTDLDDDSYPIVQAALIGGNPCIFKGNQHGGSITVATLTGYSTTPYRFDTLATNGIGLLCPRTLVHISPDLVFFVGHDGFYLYDGQRATLRVGEAVARDVIPRISPAALTSAVAWWKPYTGEVHIALPTGGSSVPTELYIFNTHDRRMYGPYEYAHTMFSAAPYATTGFTSWGAQPGTWGSQTTTWGTTGSSASASTLVLGTTNGFTFSDDDTFTTDADAPIVQDYRSGTLRPGGYVLPNNRRLTNNDVLVLREFSLHFIDRGTFTPTVQISTDGGNTWTTLASSAITSTQFGRERTATWTTDLPGTSFIWRVTGTSIYFRGVTCEFTTAGDARHD